MKTPEEIKKGLECCERDTSCGMGGCPYRDNIGSSVCIQTLSGDALAYIKDLEHQVARLEKNRVITVNGYQAEALRTASGMSDEYPMWLNGALGLTGEAGEVADMVKKHLFQGHPLDREHMAKELGDVAWYVAVTAYAIGYDLETILQMNVDKLRKRYPNGFEAERSLNREKGDI